MATYGFFPHDYFAGSYFPAVWFAPVSGEEPVVDDFVVGGSTRRRRISMPPISTGVPKQWPKEEAEALLLMGML